MKDLRVGLIAVKGSQKLLIIVGKEDALLLLLLLLLIDLRWSMRLLDVNLKVASLRV